MIKITKFFPLLWVTLGLNVISLPSYGQQMPSIGVPEQLKPLEKEVNSQINSNVKEEKAKKLLQLFFNKQFEEARAMISPELKKEVSLELLKTEWEETKAKNGQFKKITNSRLIETPGSDLIILTVEFEKITNNWIVIFNDNNEIIGTDFPIDKSIEEISVEVVNALAEGKFDRVRSYLHPFLKQDIFPQEVQARWEKIETKNGKFQKIVDTNIRQGSSLDDTDMVFMTLQFANNTQSFLILFDANNNITGINAIEN